MRKGIPFLINIYNEIFGKNDDVRYATLSSSNFTLYEYPVPKSIQGQISGMVLVDVNEDNQSFSLVNLSGGDILLSDLNPCASIIIIRV